MNGRFLGEALAAAVVCAVSAVFAAGTTATPAAAKTVKATGLAARLEQMAYAMIPEEKLNRAMGFFGPVTKKYLPVFNRFQSEYQVASKKLPVIAKYVPEAEKALADAKAMKVPAKYEAEKTEYVEMADTFVTMLKMTMKLSAATK